MAEIDPFRPPDEPNPYAAPQAHLTPVAYDRGFDQFGLEPFSIDAVIRLSWQRYTQELGVCLGAVFLSVALPLGFWLVGSVVIGGISSQNPGGGPVVAALTIAHFLAYLLIYAWIQAGCTLAVVNVARGRQGDVGDLFRGGPYFLRMCGAYLLSGLVMAGCYFVCIFPPFILYGILVAVRGGQTGLLELVFPATMGLFALVALAMLAARMYLFPYVLVDLNCGAVESILTSFRITRGRGFEVFGVAVIAIMFGYLGLLFCIVGGLFTWPLCVLMFACMYVLLASEQGLAGKAKRVRTDIEFLEP